MKNGFIKLFIIVIICSSMSSNNMKKIMSIQTIQCQEIEIKCTQSKNGNYVIRNNQEYHDMVKNISTNPNCKSYTLPVIDFNQYTLLGIVTEVAGCQEPKNNHMITKEANENYTFNLDIEQQGYCKINFSVSVWCLVPKINGSSNVEFKTNFK